MTILRRMLFNLGEGIDENDDNNGLIFARAELLANLESAAAIDETSSELGASVYLHARGVGGAPFASATTRTIVCQGGLIFQKLSAIDGATEAFAPYCLAQSEISVQLTAGDAALPRVDLICVKIDSVDGDPQSRDFEDSDENLSTTVINKAKNSRITVQTVIGTPHAVDATHPAEGSVPSGFVKWASVYVPATWNAVIDPANIYDYRMPFGLHVVDIPASNCGYDPASWTVSAIGSGALKAGAGGVPLKAWGPPGIWMRGRLLHVGVSSNIIAASTLFPQLKVADCTPNGATGGYPAGTGPDRYGTANGYDAQIASIISAGASGFRSASLLGMPPLWMDGSHAAYANQRSFTTGALKKLCLEIAPDVTKADWIGMIRLVIAGGL